MSEFVIPDQKVINPGERIPFNETSIPSNNVYHPEHYTRGGIECIQAIKASMDPNGFQDYCKGNVLKYIWRWRQKGGVEDLRKAQVYLSWLLDSAIEEETKVHGE